MLNYSIMNDEEFTNICNECSSRGNKSCKRCYKKAQYEMYKPEEVARRRAHMMMTAKITVISPATTEK